MYTFIGFHSFAEYRPVPTFARVMTGNVNICVSTALSNFTLGNVAVISNLQISNTHMGMTSPDNSFLIL